jgi:DNA-directed RNA polymerase subunit RPC12/RpoP
MATEVHMVRCLECGRKVTAKQAACDRWRRFYTYPHNAPAVFEGYYCRKCSPQLTPGQMKLDAEQRNIAKAGEWDG